MNDDGAVFKGSGSFKIDRERALLKLSQFALAKGELFLLPWVRCAAASGAKLLSAERGGGWLTVRFDGRGLAPEELKDPYGGVFDDGGDARLRHLAIGLLTCLRTDPKRILIESGEGTARRRLTVLSPREESLDPAPTDGRGTVIRVEWPFWRSWGIALPVLNNARLASPLVPPGFRFDGASPLPPPQPAGLSSEFSAGPMRGLLHLPERGITHSVVTLCVDGVAVENVKTWLPWAQVRAWVNDDGFALSASQATVVEDDRRRAAFDALAAASERFLAEAAQAHKDSSGTWEALRPWLLESAGRLLRDPADDDARPALKALWDAPLFLDAAHEPLSLRTLSVQKRRLGHVPWSRADCPGATPAERVAWCPDAAAKACLTARFGADLRDMTELIESLARAK